MATHHLSAPQAAQRRTPRWLWLILGFVLAWLVLGRGVGLLFGGGGDPGPAVSDVSEVAVRDNAFVPAAIEVPAGTTVTWRWEGDNRHNVVGDGFASEVQDSGAFAHTFNDAGAYDYECTLHAGMRGRVMVTEESA